MRITALVYLCFALLLTKSAIAAGQDDVLRQLEAKSKKVETMVSTFVQEKHLAMFDEVISSTGRFAYVSPDKLLWELTEPVATGFVLEGNTGTRWHGRTGKSESFDIRRDPMMKVVSEQLLTWARADFDKLRSQYEIELLNDDPVEMKLQPKAQEGFLDFLKIRFSGDGTHVDQVEVHEHDGDFTRIRFDAAEINRPVAAELFQR